MPRRLGTKPNRSCVLSFEMKSIGRIIARNSLFAYFSISTNDSSVTQRLVDET